MRCVIIFASLLAVSLAQYWGGDDNGWGDDNGYGYYSVGYSGYPGYAGYYNTGYPGYGGYYNYGYLGYGGYYNFGYPGYYRGDDDDWDGAYTYGYRGFRGYNRFPRLGYGYPGYGFPRFNRGYLNPYSYRRHFGYGRKIYWATNPHTSTKTYLLSTFSNENSVKLVKVSYLVRNDFYYRFKHFQ